MSLVENGEKAIAVVRASNASAQAEAYLVESESRAQEWSEGKPENFAASQSLGIGLRVIEGIVLRPDRLERLAAAVRRLARFHSRFRVLILHELASLLRR